MSILHQIGGAKSAAEIAADLQPQKQRPAEKIAEGLKEAIAVAKGEAEPYKVRKPRPNKAPAKPEPVAEAKRRGRPSSGSAQAGFHH